MIIVMVVVHAHIVENRINGLGEEKMLGRCLYGLVLKNSTFNNILMIK